MLFLQYTKHYKDKLMIPVKFPEANKLLQNEDAQPDSTLPVLDTGNTIISCWELTDDEIIELYKNKRLWVLVSTAMGTHFPISLSAYIPFA